MRASTKASFYFLILFLLGSRLAVSGVFLGADFEDFVPNVGRVRLQNVENYLLSGCEANLVLPVDTSREVLRLEKGKRVSYPSQSPKVGKYSKHLDDLKLVVPAKSEWSEVVAYLAEGIPLLGRERSLNLLRAASTKGLARVSVKNFMPEFVVNEYGKLGEFDGPNCFNTALRYYGIQNQRMESYDYEVVQALKQKFQLLPSKERLRLGDLVVFWQGDALLGSQYSIRHVAVYMGAGVVLHKASLKLGDPIVFEELSSVVRYYNTLKVEEEGVHRLSFHRRR